RHRLAVAQKHAVRNRDLRRRKRRRRRHCDRRPRHAGALRRLRARRRLLWTCGRVHQRKTGSGDPLVGNSLLLSIFAAVVVGGTRLGGGRGSPIGSIVGAYILMIVVNILLLLNVSAYYSSIAEGLILLLAVLASSISRESTLASQIRGALAHLGAWRKGLLPRQIGGGDRRLIVGAPSEAASSPFSG